MSPPNRSAVPQQPMVQVLKMDRLMIPVEKVGDSFMWEAPLGWVHDSTIVVPKPYLIGAPLECIVIYKTISLVASSKIERPLPGLGAPLDGVNGGD